MFECISDRVLAEALEQQYKQNADVSAALKAVWNDRTKLTPDQTRQLQYLFDLDDATQSNIVLFGFLVSLGGVKQLSDVARRYYNITVNSLPAKIEPLIISKFRTILFAKEPTAVLINVVSRSKYASRDYITALLEKGVSLNFDIRKTPVSVLLTDEGCIGHIPSGRMKEVRMLVETIQRLSAIVVDADHIIGVNQAGFQSARKIAEADPDDFTIAVGRYGVPKKSADAIFAQARRTERRNEQLWADLIKSRKDVRILAVAGKDQVEVPFDVSSGDPVAVNLTTLFNEMDSVECDEFNSVLSPAAYLVDLLQLLKTSVMKPNEPTAGNLLDDVFFKRRSDIAKLHLSRANTTALVPYSDLALEIMEAFVIARKSSRPNDLRSFNEPDGTANDPITIDVGNVDWGIYQHDLKDIVFPISCFPYNHATNVIKTYLQTMGCTTYELMRIFRTGNSSTSRALSAIDKRLAGPLLKAAQDRRAAAEYLNLQEEDCIAITGESFISYEATRAGGAVITREEYQKLIGYVSDGEYWGYGNEKDKSADDKMVGKIPNVKGLSFVHDELLMRSGLTFAELLRVLDTQFLGKRSIINPETSSGWYSESISDMRLENSIMPMSTDSQYLDKRFCHDLHVLIRLWRRLGWELTDLDLSIAAIATSRLSGSGSRGALVIDWEVLIDLAAIKQLQDLTSIETIKLLTLWGDLSLKHYDQLFKHPRYLIRYPELATTNGKFVAGTGFSQNAPPLCAILGLTDLDLEAVCTVTGVDKTSPWSLENVSAVLKVSVLCKMLCIPTTSYSIWLSNTADNVNTFTNPRTTLSVVQHWCNLVNGPLSAEEILEILDPQKNSPPHHPLTFQVAAQLRSELSALDSKYDRMLLDSSDEEKLTLYTNDTLYEVCFAVFGRTIGKSVVELVEGTYSASERCDVVSAVIVPVSLASKVVYVKPTLHLNGLLTPNELQAGIQSCTDEQWKSSLTKLAASALDIANGVKEYLKFSDLSMFSFELLNSVKDNTEIEQAICQRRETFLRKILPACKKAQVKEIVHRILLTAFPILDESLLLDLLQEVEVDRNLEGKVEEVGAFDYLSTLHLQPINTDEIEAFFLPAISDDYKFQIMGKNPEMAINGSSLSFSTLPYSETSVSSGMSLAQGKCHRLVTGNSQGLKSLRWTSKTILQLSSERQNVYAKSLIRNVSLLLATLATASKVVSSFNLSPMEVGYFSKKSVSFGSLDIDEISTLNVYHQVRLAVVNGRKDTLLSLMQCTPSSDATSLEELVVQIAQITTWSIEAIHEYLSAKYPDTSGKDLMKLFHDEKELSIMAESFEWSRKLGLPLQYLFDLTRIYAKDERELQFENARRFQSRLHLSSSWDLRAAAADLSAKRKDVLIGYMLAHPEMRALKITTANALFEYFLIDVQMGPQLKTSRIQQAISSIQLFVQRCQLGLEKKNSVRTTAVSQERWAWMSKFTLWQANRKVFLYPENWVEPTLRDDKSDAFLVAENMIMQSNLNLENVNNIFREYIYAANETADLEIQNYLWESSAGFQGSYHFFARTRTAPYQYYHRTLKVTGPASDEAYYSWHPWKKMNVEISSQEGSPDLQSAQGTGKAGTYLIPSVYRGRLFLFIPQILLKTVIKKSTDKSFLDMANKEGGPSDQAAENYWEIRMGWTEYRNGKWSKKEVSQTYINVTNVEPSDTTSGEIKPFPPGELPSMSSFRFWVRSRSPPATASQEANNIATENGSSIPLIPISESGDNEILVIDVVRWRCDPASAAQQCPLGRFELRGSQMVVATLESQTEVAVAWQSAIPTFYNKLTASFTGDQKVIDGVTKYNEMPGTTAERPLFALAPWSDELRNNPTHSLTWTLSFNDSQFQGISALIVDRETKSRVDSYFCLPSRNDDGSLMANMPAATTPFNLKHNLSQALMEKATTTEGLKVIFELLGNVPESYRLDIFGSMLTGGYNELGTPYSVYNWELGFHLVHLLMERLFTTQQYELALQIGRLVFDPTADDSGVDPGNGLTTIAGQQPLSNLDKCWKFYPYTLPEIRTRSSVTKLLLGLSSGLGKSKEVAAWLESPFGAHATARSRPAVYMKRFVMKYIEILIASGDEYFRQATLESLPLALQRYVEAEQLFGPPPQVIQRPTKPSTRSYGDVKNILDDFSNASVDLELAFPFFTNPATRSHIAPGSTAMTGILGMVRSKYFPIPPNPKVVELRVCIDDRLFKIRNNLDLAGNPQNLALFEPPIDPGSIVAAVASGNNGLGVFLSVQDGPMPNYRFVYHLQKAFELCAELKSLGESFLTIKEKRDAEQLNILRSKQDSAIQAITLEMKVLQKEEAERTLQALQETRQSHIMRLKYYAALTGDTYVDVPSDTSGWTDVKQAIAPPTKDELRMSTLEAIEMKLYDDASALGLLASAIEGTCSILTALPRITSQFEPMGMGVSMQFDASNIANGMMFASSVMKSNAQAMSDAAGRHSRKAQLTRQLQERRLQINIAGRDIKNVNKQMQAQKTRISITKNEITSQKLAGEHLEQTRQYWNTKYTNEKLWAWLDANVRRLFYETHNMTMEIAKSAEKSFLFERGPLAKRYLQNGYWDDARDGSLSAQHLYLGLKRMEAAYQKGKAHDFECSKNISLRQIDPFAIMELQETGCTQFSLPEILFDQDFPGHYCRRIKSVAVTVPCIVGPYTSMSCTLKLLQHRYRMKATTSVSSPYYPEQQEGDDRYSTDRIPITSIAISTGQQDSGIFNLDMQGERYGPFEGAGVISTWSLEFPSPVKQFDYSTISDVVLHVRYTALDGGALWKKKASEAVSQTLAKVAETSRGIGGAYAFFDLKNDYSDQWRRFVASDVSLRKPLVLPEITRTRLPFWTTGRTVKVTKIWVAYSSSLTVCAEDFECCDEAMECSDIDVPGFTVVVAGLGREIHPDKPLKIWCKSAAPSDGQGDKRLLDRALMVMQYSAE